MKQERIMELFKQIAIPGLVTILGLILSVNPDSAAVLVAKLIGWVLIIIGAVKAISMATSGNTGKIVSWIWAAAAVILGVLILHDPLLLAESIGRFLGVLLVIRGVDDLRRSNHQKAKILAIVTLAVGGVLILMPMALTRAILRLCGLVVAVIGIVNIVEKLQEMKLLESGEKPDIIDADE